MISSPLFRSALANLSILARHGRIAPKLAANLWKRTVMNRPVLRGVEFCVTYQCQLNCRHCLTKTLIDDRRALMTPDQVVAAAHALADLGAIFINFTGGEPLMREDIYEIVERTARRKDLMVTLASNALAFDRKAARRLRTAGCEIVVFSLDSASPQKHDASRGLPGAYDQLIEAIRIAQSESMDVWTTTILTDENGSDGDLEAMVELTRRLDVRLTINFAYPAGNWAGRRFSYSEKSMAAFNAALKNPHVRWEGSSNYRHEGCPAGDEKLYINPYGDVYPCAVLQCSFGNLLQTPVADIYGAITRLPRFDGRRKDCLAAMDSDFVEEKIHQLNLHPGKPSMDHHVFDD